MNDKTPNRLIHSSSPYLLQHAYNPVDWYEWGEDALAKARTEDKPILVSIGYSSCHWCHVMERECFEKDDIAAIMNAHFVCIKVDREERPDIDQIYMDAVQALGVNGGWPLNVFLTPDTKPFFGGTYFASPTWMQILQNIHKAFVHNRQQIEDTSEELRLHLLRSDIERFIQKPRTTDLLHDLDAMVQKLNASFDTVWGGLDRAPKFIMPSIWRFLLRYHYLTGDKGVLDHVLLSLRRMAMGGIYDQVGGGFARYSVDAYWFAPHFEKMLYDNAQLLSLYSEAYALTKDESFRHVVDETFEWLQREMTHPHGGFYSALDADSEGIEGKFYCWTSDELDRLLGSDASLMKDYFRVKPEGNWEHGMNILMREKADDVFVHQQNISKEQLSAALKRAKEILLAERATRIRPSLDDKIITAWNAMTISGLVDAHKALGDTRYVLAAREGMRFLENELMEGEIIYRSFKEKRSNVHGFLDDYAFVIRAYTDLYEVTFDEYFIHRATHFTTYVLEQFQDPKDGYFFYTAHDAERLITRKKEIFDNVVPASNSIMAENLFRLGVIMDNEGWKEIAQTMTGALGDIITGEPNYMSQWGMAYAEVRHGLAEVIVAGDNDTDLAHQLQRHFQPFMITMAAHEHSALPLVQEKAPIDGRPTIYVCYNKTCRLPVYTVADALTQIAPRHETALPQS